MTPPSDVCFHGYASVFQVPDRHGDIVLPEAFSKSLEAHRAEGRMPRLLWQHAVDKPIGTLTLVREDARGLYVQGILPGKSPSALEAATLIESAALDGLSIGFKIIKSRLAAGRLGGRPHRLLEEVELYEISIVTFAAHPLARILRTPIPDSPKK